MPGPLLTAGGRGGPLHWLGHLGDDRNPAGAKSAEGPQAGEAPSDKPAGGGGGGLAALLGDDRQLARGRGGAPGRGVAAQGGGTATPAPASAAGADPWAAGGADPWAAGGGDPWAAAGGDPWARPPAGGAAPDGGRAAQEKKAAEQRAAPASRGHGAPPAAEQPAGPQQPAAAAAAAEVPREVMVQRICAFLLQKPGQLDQRKRMLRACAQQGRSIGGMVLDAGVVEEAIQSADAKVSAGEVAGVDSTGPTPPTAEVCDGTGRDEGAEWWSNAVWEDWNGNTPWEDWSSKERWWSDDDKSEEAGKSWWLQHDDKRDVPAPSGGKLVAWEDEPEGCEPEYEAAEASTARESGADPVVSRLVAYLQRAPDAAKAMAVIRSSKSNIEPSVAEAAIARFAVQASVKAGVPVFDGRFQ